MSETPFSTNETPTSARDASEQEARLQLTGAVTKRLGEFPSLVSEIAARGVPSIGELKTVLKEKTKSAPSAIDLQPVLDEVHIELAKKLGVDALTPNQQTQVRAEVGMSFTKSTPTVNQVLALPGISFLVSVTWKSRQSAKKSTPLSEEALERIARVKKAVAANRATSVPAGDAKELLHGRLADMAVMGQAVVQTDPDCSVVWSGGASDCVIIGAYNPETRKAKMIHVDQSANSGDLGQISGWRLYLASEKFTSEEGAADKLVVNVIVNLLDRDASIAAIYPTKQLALNDEGKVLANFHPLPIVRTPGAQSFMAKRMMEAWGSKLPFKQMIGFRKLCEDKGADLGREQTPEVLDVLSSTIKQAYEELDSDKQEKQLMQTLPELYTVAKNALATGTGGPVTTELLKLIDEMHRRFSEPDA